MNKINIRIDELDYRTEEELKTLRTNLMFCGADKKVVMITSSIPGEGKSDSSMNLAISLAKLNKRVLLMDLDLRRSVMVAKCEGQDAKYGMTHFLSGQCQLTDAIYSTNIPRMHVAMAGPATPNPTELLSSEIFQKMIKSLREVYEYIIIDTAPLGLVIDAAIIAKECDGAIIVVEAGKIKYRQAQNVRDQIANSGCDVLGVILNKVEGKHHKYYNRYSRYGKYGKYGKYGGYYGHDEEPEKSEKKKDKKEEQK